MWREQWQCDEPAWVGEETWQESHTARTVNYGDFPIDAGRSRCLSRWGGLFLPRGSEGSSCFAHKSCLGTGDRKDALRLVASLGPLRERKGAFITVPDCVPTATGQVAVYRAPGSAEATWGEGGYARMGPGGAGAGGRGCPDVWNVALITKTRYQAGVGLRGYSGALSPPQYTRIQDFPLVPPQGAPQKVLTLQSWERTPFSLELCVDWD